MKQPTADSSYLRSGVWVFALSLLLAPIASAAAAQRHVVRTTLSSILETPRDASRKSALIYYAIDTAEPFMQLAVDYEIRQLRRACDASPAVNWLVVLNSASLQHKSWQACMGGQYREIPNPLADLDGWVKYFDAGNSVPPPVRPPSSEEVPVPIFQLNTGKADQQRLFASYPLAHPALLYLVLRFVTTELFPLDDYDLFLHLKSHGGPQLLLSALGPQELEKRRISQAHDWENLVQEIDQSIPLPTYRLGEAGRGAEPPAPPALLTGVGLGEAFVTPNGAQVAVPPWQHLAGGLGVTELGVGLTLESHFGLSDRALLSVLTYLQGPDWKSSLMRSRLAFLMLESCDSTLNNDGPWQIALMLQRLISGYYSAAGTLWYRNIDWDKLFSEWTRGPETSASLQALLAEWTGHVHVYSLATEPR